MKEPLKEKSILRDQGYIIFDAFNINAVEKFRDTVKESLAIPKLNSTHNYFTPKDINSARIKSFKAINNILNWPNDYSSIAKPLLNKFLGPDLAIQSKLNLSIQMPRDKTSILSMHTDSLSGQSIFEMVLWVPLTDSFETNSMYIFSPEITLEILNNMSQNEEKGMNFLFDEYSNHAKFLNIPFGKALLFSPTLFHGNILNTTDKTRVSINCRYKNIFSLESTFGERRLGSFYKILELSELSKLALSLNYEDINF